MKRINKKLIENSKELNKIHIYHSKYKGIDVWFTDERVKLPENCNLYKYELRHDNGDVIEISSHILVDFYGTIISKQPIVLPKTSLNLLSFDDINENDFEVMDYFNPITVLDLIIENIVDSGDKNGNKTN